MWSARSGRDRLSVLSIAPDSGYKGRFAVCPDKLGNQPAALFNRHSGNQGQCSGAVDEAVAEVDVYVVLCGFHSKSIGHFSFFLV